MYKNGVKPSLPFLPSPAVFKKEDEFREFLLTKCTNVFKHTFYWLTICLLHVVINAERAALHSPEFLSSQRRTRKELLTQIVKKFKPAAVKEDGSN